MEISSMLVVQGHKMPLLLLKEDEKKTPQMIYRNQRTIFRFSCSEILHSNSQLHVLETNDQYLFSDHCNVKWQRQYNKQSLQTGRSFVLLQVVSAHLDSNCDVPKCVCTQNMHFAKSHSNRC